MLFRLLKLFGLDVPAKVAAAKLVVEQRAEEVAQYVGQTVQTGVVGGVLVAAALILFLIARAKGQSLSSRRISRPLHPIPVAASSPAPVVATADLASASYHAPGEVHPKTARDLLEPLALLLPKYIKYPALGHPALNELVENLGATARGIADEALDKAANLVRHGDRKQLFALLGGALFVGWLLARQDPDIRLGAPAE
jgi:hypothetical protein